MYRQVCLNVDSCVDVCVSLVLFVCMHLHTYKHVSMMCEIVTSVYLCMYLLFALWELVCVSVCVCVCVRKSTRVLLRGGLHGVEGPHSWAVALAYLPPPPPHPFRQTSELSNSSFSHILGYFRPPRFHLCYPEWISILLSSSW